MRLIDADKLTASQSLSGTLYYPMAEIENAPTIDIVRMAAQMGYEQVVRCKDCRYFKMYKCRMGYSNHDDFCSYGERNSEVDT